MTLKTAIKKKKISEIRKITKATPIADIADLLEEMDNSQRVVYFRLLKTETQSEIFAQLEPEYQEQVINSFTDEQIKNLISELYTADIVDLIEDVPENLSLRILKATDKETRKDVNKLLKYDDDLTGSIMQVDIVTLKQSMTVSQAIEAIKKEKDNVQLAHYFFVTDAKKHLVGYLALEDLFFETKSTKISKIMKASPSVSTTSDKEEAAMSFANYDMSVLPVVNSAKEVIGMITSQDVIDVVTEEATEDIEKMAGITSDDTPYSKKTIFSIFKSRTLWLMLLMISATISQIVLDSFQGISNATAAIAFTTAIVAILPVISGAAGNAGAQSSTTVIRALSTGDISTKDYLKVLWKELRVSVLIGALLAIANFARLVIYYAVKDDLNTDYIFLSLAASISLFIVIILAKAVGGTLPLLAKKMKLDPAIMAAPLLTTLIDALSTMIFFGISIGIMVMVL
ncbi:MAG: magnesium transporter [Mycoplasmataceae bacterium]|nr:magnesium transporter [Mycoplasmataceae bacterium]